MQHSVHDDAYLVVWALPVSWDAKVGGAGWGSIAEGIFIIMAVGGGLGSMLLYQVKPLFESILYEAMYLKTLRTTWCSGLSLKYVVYKGVVPVVGAYWAPTEAMAMAEATAWRITQMVLASQLWMSFRLIIFGVVDLLAEVEEGELFRSIGCLYEVTAIECGLAFVAEFETAVNLQVNDIL